MSAIKARIRLLARLYLLSKTLLLVICAGVFNDVPPAIAESASVSHSQVVRYKSITLRSAPFASAIAGNSEIADVLPISSDLLYIQGRKVGTTNITLYDRDRRSVRVIDLDVTLDLNDIATRIRSGTESRGIRVSAVKNQIILSGEARNAVDADRAVAIAKSMVTTDDGREVDPKEADKYVVNAMQVAASQQVMLRVRFVEVDRTAERDIGVNWFGANKGQTAGANIGSGALTQVGQSPSTTPAEFRFSRPLGLWFPEVSTGATTSSPFGVGLLKLAGGNIDLLISALESKGMARRLAEPDLVALSGDTASFLAGGEYPVPSVQSSSGSAPVITTSYRRYGVQLTFVPTVLANELINLRLNPSVSELDSHQRRRDFRHVDPVDHKTRDADDDRTAGRSKLRHRRASPVRRIRPQCRSVAVDRFGAGSRRAVQQQVLSGGRDRSRRHRDAASRRPSRGGAGARHPVRQEHAA